MPMRRTHLRGPYVVLVALALSFAAWAMADSTRTDTTRADSTRPDATRADTARAQTTRAVPAGDPSLGKKLFAAKKCATCHKADGSGGVRLSGNPTPNWRDAKRMSEPKYGDDYLRECLTNGRPKSGMPSWGKSKLLKSVEIGHLIAYIHTFSAPPPKK